MRLIPQSVSFVQKPPKDVLKIIESAGRTCYQSHHKVEEGSEVKFAKMILGNKHLSQIRHCVATLRWVTDRGVLAEVTRHQLSNFDGEDASWLLPFEYEALSVESTRYVDYSKEDIDFILPVWMEDSFLGVYHTTISPSNDIIHDITFAEAGFINGCLNAEHFYKLTRSNGWTAQKARQLLPMATKTEIVITCNMQQWRNIFEQRCPATAHPQCRSLLLDSLNLMHEVTPILFDDLAAEFLIAG